MAQMDRFCEAGAVHLCSRELATRICIMPGYGVWALVFCTRLPSSPSKTCIPITHDLTRSIAWFGYCCHMAVSWRRCCLARHVNVTVGGWNGALERHTSMNARQTLSYIGDYATATTACSCFAACEAPTWIETCADYTAKLTIRYVSLFDLHPSAAVSVAGSSTPAQAPAPLDR